MVVAEFKGNETTKYVGDVYQYDLGQVLCIKGLNLPKFVEIDFALQETGSTTESEVGITRNGVTEVEIPNHMLINNDTDANYMIYAFVYLTDETSGETIRKIRISVKARSKPENFTAPEDTKLFQEAIKAVNESAERAESAEQKVTEHAEQTKADAQQTTADRREVEKLVDSVSGISEQVQAVKDYKEQAQTAATNALLSERASEQAKEAALQAQAGAETAEGMAEQHALETAGDKAEVERLATQVRQDKTAVETAKNEAINAIQVEGTTQTGNVTAEGKKQVQAVQNKGQQIIDSIVEIQVNNPSTTYTLQPNIQVVWGEVAELNLTLAPEKPNAINIYPFWFKSGATPTKVTLPATIILDNFVTKPNKKYCCQIEQNVLFWKEFEVVA